MIGLSVIDLISLITFGSVGSLKAHPIIK